MMQQPLTVSDYRRFSQATQRAAARCRARLSPLRVLDRRSWSDPGFEQRDSDPVVCISHSDAQDYADWLSRQTGHSYRVPGTSERRRAARSQAAGALQGRRDLSEWMINCAETSSDGGCSHRIAFAADSGERSAQAERGYDDIGLRLLRELTLETLPPGAR
jgi:formylglycine-generating enzyme required for sulfatase activity